MARWHRGIRPWSRDRRPRPLSVENQHRRALRRQPECGLGRLPRDARASERLPPDGRGKNIRSRACRGKLPSSPSAETPRTAETERNHGCAMWLFSRPHSPRRRRLPIHKHFECPFLRTRRAFRCRGHRRDSRAPERSGCRCHRPTESDPGRHAAVARPRTASHRHRDSRLLLPQQRDSRMHHLLRRREHTRTQGGSVISLQSLQSSLRLGHARR
mmetsp:Transcript_34521/g.74593  ORF Transcript_34521/g.74593 Transcript_34521/m.74593 type:complete len:215 (+) Transcript_34521:444-1088(+)